MIIKVKHIIPIILILLLIYFDYISIKFLVFENHTKSKTQNTVYGFSLFIQIIFLTVYIIRLLSENWEKTLINTNKIKSQITKLNK